MQYALRLTNFTVTAGIRKFDESWVRLQQSAANFEQKVVAIRVAVAAWPATLRGCSTVHLGPRHLRLCERMSDGRLALLALAPMPAPVALCLSRCCLTQVTIPPGTRVLTLPATLPSIVKPRSRPLRGIAFPASKMSVSHGKLRHPPSLMDLDPSSCGRSVPGSSLAG